MPHGILHRYRPYIGELCGLQALEEMKCYKCCQLVEPHPMTVSGRGGSIGQDWSEHEKRHSPAQVGCPGHRKRVPVMGGLQLVRCWEKASQCGALTNGRCLG